MSSYAIYALRTAEDRSARIHSSLKQVRRFLPRAHGYRRVPPRYISARNDEGLDDGDLLPE